VKDKPTALLLFDLYFRHMQREQEVAERRRRGLRFAVEGQKLAAWERRRYRQASTVACVSDVDARALSPLLGRPVEVIPNPIPEDFFAAPEVPRSDNTVLFVGHLAWRPNVEAVEWLTTEVWPRVTAHRPDAVLAVVGSHPSRSVVDMVASVGGRLDANVPDIRPFYWGAAASVAPVRLGSGVRNKVLHAMACGSPVVSTGAALEGIGALEGEHLLIGDDAGEFAQAVVAALEDHTASAARAARAFELVQGFRSDRICDRLDGWWRSVATPGSSIRRPAAPAVRQSEQLTASVLVCTRDRPELLRDALNSISRAMQERPAELVVVEQGTPSAAPICAELGLSATIVRDPGVGVSRARNIGLRHATKDVVLITDDDCKPPSSWISDHMSQYADVEVMATYGPVTGLSRAYRESEAAIAASDPTALQLRYRAGAAPWLVGHSANMAARRDALLSLKGFDERLGPPHSGGGEDADLIFRLLLAGGTAVTGVGAPVAHASWRSTEQFEDTFVAYEQGAGTWIGKALREHGRDALPYVAKRLRMLHEPLSRSRRDDRALEPRVVVRGARAFIQGLASGLRLGRWDGPMGGSDGEPGR
jgi:GT2 family glycosyltransferase